MRIGISVLTMSGQNIWSNGLGQNVIFLARLLRHLPFVESVVLIDAGDQAEMAPQVDAEALGLPLARASDAGDQIDVIIEMAGALDHQWLGLMRARGKKVVYACCGQPFVALVEPAVFGKPAAALQPQRCDEVWVLPKDEEFAPMLRTIHRCDVHVMPFIWEPYFLQRRIDEISALGYAFGYKPRPHGAGLRAAVFEPNISVVKSSVIPMLACDQAYRAEPACLQGVHVLNTLHMKEHPTMLHFANSLDFVREHKAVFHGRHDIAGFMAQHADAVVAHQWRNAQNYAYLDVLYGDYPLVHNSPWLRSAGYYYPDFDSMEAAHQLRLAAATHDERLDDYRMRSRRVIQEVDILNPANLDAYARRLQALRKAPHRSEA